MKKIIILALLVAVMSSSLVFAGGVQFDPKKVINDGKPIQIEFWAWEATAEFQAFLDEYTKIHPNVTFTVRREPWNDFWTKLPLALQSGSGPAMFNIHNSQHDNLINYLAPYDINIDELRNDFVGVDAHVINGKVYYIDYGIMTGGIFYNKKMWKEAGLTDADFPKTWEQLRAVAKKLTKVDGKGNIVQAGFDFNKQFDAMWQGLNYQRGELLFKTDQKTANFDNATTAKNAQFLVDLYNVDKVGSKDLGTQAQEDFGQGLSAMVYAWGWFGNFLKNNFPDIEWGYFRVPTFGEAVPFAYDRYNGESTMGVNKGASPEAQAVAQDVIRFYLTNDQIQRASALMYGCVPAKNRWPRMKPS
jgi:multiple sugar transport system substrate-binding protein